MTLVSLNSETIGYNGEAVLRDVSLSVEAGETLVLIGESGVGKSTLLAHLYRLCAPAASLVPQELGLADQLSVFHNVYMGRLDQHSLWTNFRNLIWPAEPFLTDIRTILKDLSLEDKLRTRPTELSGGQRQRVAVARAIYAQADIVIADEPVSAMDMALGNEVLHLLTARHETCILALHDVDAALAIADRLIGLKDGKIAFDKTPAAVSKSDLQDLYERH